MLKQLIYANSFELLHMITLESHIVIDNAQYSDFLDRAQLLTQKLHKQGYAVPMLKSTIQAFYGRHHELVDSYEISISQMTMDRFLST